MFNITSGLVPKSILHIDADAFFVSVERALNPNLNNKLIAVGSLTDRGVVCSAGYEARQFGVHSGMSVKKALSICPQLNIIKPNFTAYKFFSNQLFDILQSYSPHIERTSIDEGYIDLTGSEKMAQVSSSKELALKILNEINQKLNIPVSGGLASSKLIAHVASKLYKPHKFIFVPQGYEKRFLWPLPIESIPGVGKKTSKLFQLKGINTVGDFGDLSLEKILKNFDLFGLNIWQKIHGLVQDEIRELPSEAKSISHETTFSHDLDDFEVVRCRLLTLINKVLFRLRKQGMQAGVIALKLRSADFKTYTFHRKLSYPSSFDGDIAEEVSYLLRENFDKYAPLRLIGFGVEKLQSMYNLSLFQEDVDAKNRLVSHIDQLRRRHGFEVVSYGV